ncbi:hypothetical protein [Jannaschia marina]|uniref:hypothetical protein n=1 Tax=Jannaschia marina TaxID=2741674 RepID=UPI0015CD8295|nr:hypothetical protein [Jannaschia marina]
MPQISVDLDLEQDILDAIDHLVPTPFPDRDTAVEVLLSYALREAAGGAKKSDGDDTPTAPDHVAGPGGGYVPSMDVRGALDDAIASLKRE